MLADSRIGKNSRHGLVGPPRQSSYGHLAGYEDVNDADRLGDAIPRCVGSSAARPSPWIWTVPSVHHGDQEGTTFNGHLGYACYRPLFVFNQFGNLERCALRPGNVHRAHDWRDVLELIVARHRGERPQRFFRADTALALPDAVRQWPMTTLRDRPLNPY